MVLAKIIHQNLRFRAFEPRWCSRHRGRRSQQHGQALVALAQSSLLEFIREMSRFVAEKVTFGLPTRDREHEELKKGPWLRGHKQYEEEKNKTRSSSGARIQLQLLISFAAEP